jgi:pyridoxamine 5'-phosphate oxidase
LTQSNNAEIGVADLRRDYRQRFLNESQIHADPFVQFANWLAEAITAEVMEPNAMSLATVDAAGQPTVRIVLLKHSDHRGLAFYTNYQSRKAAELAGNPRAAVAFWWPELERSVRVEGTTIKTDPSESDAYFARRPFASQIGAVASDQSRPVENRSILEARFDELRAAHPGQSIPRPENWGGYRIVPHRFEFWQGRQSRLHDRIEYLREGDRWVIRRLQP